MSDDTLKNRMSSERTVVKGKMNRGKKRHVEDFSQQI